MDVSGAAIVFAIAVGIVTSGLVGSLWHLATDEFLEFSHLFDPYPDFWTPFRVLSIVFSSPNLVLLNGFAYVAEKPFVGIPVFAVGLGWSFLYGVFILTQVFGFT